jgi:hypothetical protein
MHTEVRETGDVIPCSLSYEHRRLYSLAEQRDNKENREKRKRKVGGENTKP